MRISLLTSTIFDDFFEKQRPIIFRICGKLFQQMGLLQNIDDWRNISEFYAGFENQKLNPI